MRKVFIVFLCFLLLIQVAAQPVSANPIARIVAGSVAEKVLKGVAEKAGMKFASKKQSDQFVSYMNSQSSKNPAYNKFISDFNSSVNSQKPQNESGWKKYVLDPMMWVTGADIFWGAYQAFNDAYNSGGSVPTEQEYVVDPSGFTCIKYDVKPSEASFKIVGYGKSWFLGYWSDSDPSKLVCEARGFTITDSDSKGVRGYLNWARNGRTDYIYTTLIESPSGGITRVGSSSSFIKMVGLPVASSDLPVVIDYYVPPLNKLPESIPILVPDDVLPPENVSEDDVWNKPIKSEIDLPVPEPEGDKPTDSGWWKWLFDLILKPVEGILSLLGSLANVVGGLVGTLLDGLLGLFVPSDHFFKDFFNSFKNIFDSKIPIIPQLNEFFTSVNNASIGGDKPIFEVTMPDQYGGGTFSILDFSVYDQYRVWILNFIRFSSWFVFLRRLYNRIPRMIY